MKKKTEEIKRRMLFLYEKICVFLEDKEYLNILFAFSFFFIVFCLMYFSVNSLTSGDDHFFHFRFAEQMRQNGFLESFRNFKAIYFSKMAQGNNYFVYFDFLFYLVILPFTFIQPLFLGIKVYGVLAASIAFTSLYLIVKKIGVKYSFLWTMVVLSIIGNPLLFRFFSSRPYTLEPALLLLLLFFIHKKRYPGVFFITLFYFFWHSTTFFFPLSIAFLYLVFEKFYGNKGDFKNLLAGLFGTLFGLVLMYLIAPGFLNFINDIFFGIFKENIIFNKVSLPLGGETYPIDIFNLIKLNPLFICFLFISITIFIYKYLYIRFGNCAGNIKISEDKKTHQIFIGTVFFISISCLMGTILVSGRFEDFLVFFGGIFIIISFDEVIFCLRVEDVLVRKALNFALMVSVIYLFACNLLFLQESMAVGGNVETFKPVGEWLNKNVPKGEIIFNLNWDWFPQLYYHSPTHNYIVGLNPRYLYVYNQNLYWEWSNISKGYLCDLEDCSGLIRESKIALSNTNKNIQAKWYKTEGDRIANALILDFHSHYLISAISYGNLNSIMNNSNRFEKILSDRDSFFIYRVKDIDNSAK